MNNELIRIENGKNIEENGINFARKPKGYKDEKVICPNCDYLFGRATRCPNCGQLISYSISEHSETSVGMYRQKYKESFKKYVEEKTTRERALQGKEPLKSVNTIISDTFIMEDIKKDTPFSYWLESDEKLEEARNILIAEFTKRMRNNPKSDANQYIKDMVLFKEYFEGLKDNE